MSVCKCLFHRNHSKLFIEIKEDKESTKDKKLIVICENNDPTINLMLCVYT